MLPDLLHTCIHVELHANRNKFCQLSFSLPLSLSAVATQAVGSFPCRWELWEETKSAGMKTAVSLWENSLHCKAPLLHYHGNGEESMCWSQSLKVTQYLHVLIISPPYERNITSLASMMKTHIRSFQPVYLSSEHGEPAIKFKTRKWTAHILVSLTNTQVDEAWFQTITYYFWLGLFKWDKIGQNHWCVSSLE